MTNYKLHNDCKIISQNTYNETKQQNINGWGYSKSVIGRNGFYADIYRKDNKIIIAVRGTDIGKGKLETIYDVYEDAQMAVFRKLPTQVNYAREVYKEYKNNNPDAKIILTGHSLGGSVVQALGSETGAETVTFGAFGIADTYSQNFRYTENITNYGNAQDPVFISNINHHLGKTIVLNVGLDNVILTPGINLPRLSSHYIENIGDLSKGAEYKQEFFNGNVTPLFKTGIEITPEELDMREQSNKHAQEEWEYYKRTGKHMPITMSSNCAGSYPVSGYTRSDGTKVSSYTRTCGAKHIGK